MPRMLAPRRNRPLPRRSTEWGAFSLDFEGALLDTTVFYSVFQASDLLVFENPTIVRTHMRAMAILSNGSAEANVHEQLCIGIGVAPQEAITAGALPPPYSNAAWGGWLLWWVAELAHEHLDQGTSFAGQRDDVDSRAMRRIQEGDGVFLAVQAPSTNLTTVNYSFSGRMLFKE